MEFTKMTGNGNDFVVIDDRENEFLGKEGIMAIKFCDRHFGIGADGVLFVRKSKKASIQMIIINADGSYASMCGNGIRCFAKYVWEKHIVSENPLTIETGDGIKKAYLCIENEKVKSVKINMGNPSLNSEKLCKEKIINKEINVQGKQYKMTSLFMGVPHTVIFGKLGEYDVEEGKYIEKLPIFKEGTNVNFCEIINYKKIKVKTWERGAGPTLACGTGSCASVVASNLLKYTDKKVEVILSRGRLFIEITEDGIFMDGPAEICFRGEIDV
ncbi:diaminopimelate epimerase [Clostridium niameyense]|uniref:Diaminopimelate epimerase n=1 Tax=Clostridium niameyense TaxID=1622073 RepID=A0A6M0R7X6_9CLOT|nr:diaminopimelate epimerase [Clostridium niameyense]NEZ46333.1 diaminopimelate epimerase [Clostridium niameyense]